MDAKIAKGFRSKSSFDVASFAPFAVNNFLAGIKI